MLVPVWTVFVLNAVGINISKERDKSRHLLLFRQHKFVILHSSAGTSSNVICWAQGRVGRPIKMLNINPV